MKQLFFPRNNNVTRFFCKNYNGILILIEYSNLPKGLKNKEKAGILQPAVCIGDPNGTRTHITTVKG